MKQLSRIDAIYCGLVGVKYDLSFLTNLAGIIFLFLQVVVDCVCFMCNAPTPFNHCNWCLSRTTHREVVVNI